MLNKNYVKDASNKFNNQIERVVNDKLKLWIATNNPPYLESSEDRPNFYNIKDFETTQRNSPLFIEGKSYSKFDIVNFQGIIYIAKENLIATTPPNISDKWEVLNKDNFTDKNISLYEESLVFEELIFGKSAVQAYLIDNSSVILTIKPRLFSNQVNDKEMLKKLFNLNYIKMEIEETKEVRYLWITSIKQNEGRFSSITLFLYTDFWLSFYKEVVLNMSGDVLVLQKHFNRFKYKDLDTYKAYVDANSLPFNKNRDYAIDDKVSYDYDFLGFSKIFKCVSVPIEGEPFNIDNWEIVLEPEIIPNYDYSSPIYNIDESFANLPKNVVELKGYSRPQLSNGTTFNVEDNSIYAPSLSLERGIFFSRFNNAGQQTTEYENSSPYNLSNLESVSGDLSLSAWNNFWTGTINAYGSKQFSVSESVSGKFLYTFQYNVSETTPTTNIDETAGIQSFTTAQTNNGYTSTPITNPAYINDTDTPFIDPKIKFYERQIINRVGNIINDKFINEEDNLGNETIINGQRYWFSTGTGQPTAQNPILVASHDGGQGFLFQVFKWKPYKLVETLGIFDGTEIININVPIWNAGGLIVKTFRNGSIQNIKTTDNIMVFDFLKEIDDIEFTAISPNSGNIQTTLKVITKPNEETKKTYSLNEINKDNYNELIANFSLKEDGYDEFLSKKWEINSNKVDWDWTNEPQLYLQHSFSRVFNYLGASKTLPYNIFGNDFKMYLQQTITPSTNIDNIIAVNSNKKSRLTFANGGVEIEYSNALPSVSDSFKSYIQTNQGQLKTSYLTAQNDLQYAKNKQIADITLGAIGTAGSLVSGLGRTKTGERVFEDPFFVEMNKRMPGEWNVPIKTEDITKSNFSTNNLLGLGASITTLANGILGGNKAIFNAKQQIRGIGAVVGDTYNTPDALINPSNDIIGVQNFNRRINDLFNNNSKGAIIRAVETIQLPTLNNLKVYSNYINQYGYISNEMLLEQNIETLLNRNNFNYIRLGETQNLFRNINLDNNIKSYFMNLFSEGVRLWNNPLNMLDYSKENKENKL